MISHLGKKSQISLVYLWGKTFFSQVFSKNTSNILFFVFPAAPFWISAPKNLILAPNETGILTCRVNGSPKPKISWFVNGVPIESECLQTLRLTRIWCFPLIRHKYAAVQLMTSRINNKESVKCHKTTLPQRQWKGNLKLETQWFLAISGFTFCSLPVSTFFLFLFKQRTLFCILIGCWPLSINLLHAVPSVQNAFSLREALKSIKSLSLFYL